MCIRDRHVTEACVLTAGKHPVSVFSMIHSSAEKDYKSVNTITFDAIRQAEMCIRDSGNTFIHFSEVLNASAKKGIHALLLTDT